MKAILSYGTYFSYGKQYQIKFVYENEEEANIVSTYMKNFSNNDEFKEQYEKNSSIISSTNIPKDILLQFISGLITICNSKLIIGNEEFTTMDLIKINEAIDKLHINILLCKDNYFCLGEMYFAKFKYATTEQREEVSYDFNYRLNSIIGQDFTLGNNTIFPYSINEKGNITIENTGIVGGTNIPEQLLPFFIKRFVEEYNAVITIDNKIFKDTVDLKKLQQAFANIDNGRARIRKQK